MNSLALVVKAFGFILLLQCAASLKLILKTNQNEENQNQMIRRNLPELLQAPDVLGNYALESCTFKKGRLEGQTVNAGTDDVPRVLGFFTITSELFFGQCQLKMSEYSGIKGSLAATWTLADGVWNLNVKHLDMKLGYKNETNGMVIAGGASLVDPPLELSIPVTVSPEGALNVELPDSMLDYSLSVGAGQFREVTKWAECTGSKVA